MAKGDIFTLDEVKALPQTLETKREQPVSVSSPVNTNPTGVSFKQNIVAPLVGAMTGVGKIARPLQNKIGNTLNQVSGREIFPEITEKTAEQAAQNFGIDTNKAAYKVPRFGGETFPYVVGGNAATLPKSAGLLTRSLSQGLTAGAIKTGQEGEINKDVLITAGVAGASVPVGEAVSAGLNKISKTMPDWLVRPLVKQTKTAKEQGKDIVPFMTEKGRIGTVDSLVKQSDDQMTLLSGQIDDVLRSSDKKVNLASIADDVADDINRAGGDTSADEILDIVQKQAFRVRGRIKDAAVTGDDISIIEANRLRSELDEALYKGKEYLQAVPPENRQILEEFTNRVRGSVQTLEPSTREAFKEWAKEITLKKALISAQSASQGRNALNAMDLITAGGAGLATGNPVTGLAAAGARRAFESPVVKTTLARVFSNADDVALALEKASPATRAVVIQFIDELLGNTDDTDQQLETEMQ